MRDDRTYMSRSPKGQKGDMKDPKICGDSININGVYICRLECLPCSHVEGCSQSKAEALVDALIKSIKGE